MTAEQRADRAAQHNLEQADEVAEADAAERLSELLL